MKTRKRFLSILAALCLSLLLAVPAMAADGEGYGGAALPDGPDMGGTVINVNAENAQYVLDGAYGSIDGKTIVFSAGDYSQLELGRATKYAGSNTDYYIGSISAENKKTFDEFVAIKTNGQWSASAYYVRNMSNVTLKAAEGATVNIAGLVASSGHVYGNVYDYVLDKQYESGSAYFLSQILKNITIEGIHFTGKVDFSTSSENTEIDGVTFENCTFNINNTASGNQALRYYNESDNGQVKNLTVTGCEFNNCYQGVYTQKINGVTVTDSNFDTTGHNAIAVQSGSGAVNHKAVVITGNTFTNIGDRVIRFGDVGADTQITITNNTATNSGDSSGQVIKAQSLANGITYNIHENNWGEGRTSANKELRDALPVAQINGTQYYTLAAAIAAAQPGDTVTLLTDTTVGVPGTSNFWINKSITLNLNTHTVTGAYQLALGVNNAAATVIVKNGTLTGGIVADVYLNAGTLKLQNVTVTSTTAGCAIQNNDGDLELEGCTVETEVDDAGAIWDFSTNHKIVIKNSNISAKDYWAVYHNGSTGGFVLEATDSTFECTTAQGIYISGSTSTTAAAGKNQQATFTNCTITGTTGIEGKYTDITLTNCTVTATEDEPTFDQYNNGSTTDGFAVVSTDNSMTPSSPAPSAAVIIDGGKYKGLVGLSQLINKTQYPDFKEASYSISGGYFTSDVTMYCVAGKKAATSTEVNGYTYKVQDIVPADVAGAGNVGTSTSSGSTAATVDESIAPAYQATASSVASGVDANSGSNTLSGAKADTPAETVALEKADAVIKLESSGIINVSSEGAITDAVGGGSATVTVVYETYLDVTVTEFSSTENTITLDIEPKYNIKATISSDPTNSSTMTDANTVTLATAQPMTIDAEKSVDITIPLPAGFAEVNDKVFVTHTKADGRVFKHECEVKDNGGLYITFTNENGFSAFAVSLPAAQIGATNYATLQDAVDAVTNGQTIKILTASQEATVSRTVKFTVDPNGKDYSITLGSYCTDNDAAADVYDIVYNPPVVVSTYTVAVADSANGTVTSSAARAARGSTVTLTVKADEGYALSKLTVTSIDGQELTLTDKGDGAYTFTMPAGKVTVTAVFAAEKCDGGESCPTHPYTDIDTSEWYHTAVDYVITHDMMSGFGGGVFGPDRTFDRAMMVQVLYNLEKKPETALSDFTDLVPGMWYVNAVSWAATNGIAAGYGSTFGPETPITREQVAQFLYNFARFKGYDLTARADLSQFVDGDKTSGWAQTAMQWAVASGILGGKGGKVLDPTATATRAEVAQMLMSFCEKVAK